MFSLARIAFVSIALASLSLLSALAESAPSPRQHSDAKAAETIAGLTWMAGTWVREDADGQYLEETWSSPSNGALVGMFRWNRGGKPFMCEMMTIALESDKAIFRLRHFDVALKPWEKELPLTYAMSKVGENEIVFEDPNNAPDHPRRFVYKRTGDELAVRLENADGGGDEFTFKLKSASESSGAKPKAAAATPSPLGFEGGLVLKFLVTDRAKSREWYKEMLGFEVLFEVDEIGWTEMANTEAKLTIGLQQSDAGPPSAVGGTVPVVGVKNLDAARKHLESKGVKFTGETVVHEGLVKLATLLDPDGHQIMLFESLGG